MRNLFVYLILSSLISSCAINLGKLAFERNGFIQGNNVKLNGIGSNKKDVYVVLSARHKTDPTNPVLVIGEAYKSDGVDLVGKIKTNSIDITIKRVVDSKVYESFASSSDSDRYLFSNLTVILCSKVGSDNVKFLYDPEVCFSTKIPGQYTIGK